MIAKCCLLHILQGNLKREQRTVLQFNWVLMKRILTPVQSALFLVHAWPSHCDGMALTNALCSIKTEVGLLSLQLHPNTAAVACALDFLEGVGAVRLLLSLRLFAALPCPGDHLSDRWQQVASVTLVSQLTTACLVHVQLHLSFTCYLWPADW